MEPFSARPVLACYRASTRDISRRYYAEYSHEDFCVTFFLFYVSSVNLKRTKWLGESEIDMAAQSVALRALLRQRHWTYATFCAEYDRAAKGIDPKLTGSWPSRAQFHRWINGELRGMPYPDACRVLEALFPGWTAEQLFGQITDEQLALTAAQAGDEQEPADPPRLDVDRLLADRFSDVSAVYATRSEFVSAMPPHTLFDSASQIRACGLSLNLLCQQYADQSLRQLAESGTEIQCLFLDPDGQAIGHREREEGFRAGHLADLTRINIVTLQERVRDKLSPDARSRFAIAVYDQTIRFNITFIDDSVGIIQPYMPSQRGVDSPTFVLHRRWPDLGLFPTFETVFSSLWSTGKPL